GRAQRREGAARAAPPARGVRQHGGRRHALAARRGGGGSRDRDPRREGCGVTAMQTAREALAACRAVEVRYGEGDSAVCALAGVDLEIRPRGSLALLGRSGSGKTTLLHVLGGLVEPTAGTVEWQGRQLASLDRAARGAVRAHGIAYVFQGANLLPHFTAVENVAFAAHLSGGSELAPEGLLELVGLSAKADKLPAELVRGPGRTLLRVLTLASAVGLLGAMVLFVGHSLGAMTGSAVRSVPLDWQGPVTSGRAATAVARRVARQPGVAEATPAATAPFAGIEHVSPAAGTIRSGAGAILAVPPRYLAHIDTFRFLRGSLRPGEIVFDQQLAATLQVQ